jgi:hypothetical protein
MRSTVVLGPHHLEAWRCVMFMYFFFLLSYEKRGLRRLYLKWHISPGPVGFLEEFYEVFWDIIEDDLMDLFHSCQPV